MSNKNKVMPTFDRAPLDNLGCKDIFARHFAAYTVGEVYEASPKLPLTMPVETAKELLSDEDPFVRALGARAARNVRLFQTALKDCSDRVVAAALDNLTAWKFTTISEKKLFALCKRGDKLVDAAVMRLCEEDRGGDLCKFDAARMADVYAFDKNAAVRAAAILLNPDELAELAVDDTMERGDNESVDDYTLVRSAALKALLKKGVLLDQPLTDDYITEALESGINAQEMGLHVTVQECLDPTGPYVERMGQEQVVHLLTVGKGYDIGSGTLLCFSQLCPELRDAMGETF